MDKEKEIQEMAELLYPYNQNYYDCSNCEYCRVINKDECDLDSFAKKLYNAGYRKSDEVRKETAKVLLEDFNKFLNNNLLALMLSNQLGQDYDLADVWNRFCLLQYEEYGVEVTNY